MTTDLHDQALPISACGSTARLAVLQALAAHPEGLHVAELTRCVVQATGRTDLSSQDVALYVLRPMRRRPSAGPEASVPALIDCERHGANSVWYSPASRAAAALRYGWAPEAARQHAALQAAAKLVASKGLA